jgi:hypothetical protein
MAADSDLDRAFIEWNDNHPSVLIADINEALAEVAGDVEATLDHAASADLRTAEPGWLAELANSIEQSRQELSALLINAHNIITDLLPKEARS